MNALFTSQTIDGCTTSIDDFSKWLQGSTADLSLLTEDISMSDLRAKANAALKGIDNDNSAGARMKMTYAMALARDTINAYATRGEILRRSNNQGIVELNQAERLTVLYLPPST